MHVKLLREYSKPQMITKTICRIIPNDWRALSRHGPNDPKQADQREKSAEGVTF